MVGSFILLALVVLLYITCQTLTAQFSFLESWLPYIYWAIWIAVAIFALFVIIALFNAIFPKNKK
jgi:hypothetical protein